MSKGVSWWRASARLARLAMYIFYLWLLLPLYWLRYGRQWFDTTQGRRLISSWARGVSQILALRLHTDGTPGMSPNTLFVANHISWLDIVVLSTVIQPRFIAKASLRHWPVFGWLARISGTLFIERGKIFTIHRVVDDIRHALDKPVSVLLFAEGTTTDGRQVARFHAGLFRSVSTSRHFVQAVSLRYWRNGEPDTLAPYIGKDNFIMHLCRMASLREIRVELVFTPPFQAVGMSRQAIAEATRAAIVGVWQEGRISARQRCVA